MSLSLDINNFYEVDDGCDNFDSLFGINKNFLENSNNFNVDYTSCSGNNYHQSSSIFGTNFCDNLNYFDGNDTSNTQKDIKTQISNESIDNKNSNDESNKNDTITSAEIGEIPLLNMSIEKLLKLPVPVNSSNNNRHHNRNGNIQSDNFNDLSTYQNNFEVSNSNPIGSHHSNQKLIQKHSSSLSSKRQKCKLLFSHNNELKPIISPMIKSGVYRKAYTQKPNDSPSENHQKKSNNVCFLSKVHTSGKIISLKDFQKNYTEENSPAETQKSSKNHPQFEIESLTKNLLEKLENFVHLKDGQDNIILNKEKNEIIYKNHVKRKQLKYRLIQPENFNDLKNSIVTNKNTNSSLSTNIPDIKDCLLQFLKLNRTSTITATATTGNMNKPSSSSSSRRGRPRKLHHTKSTISSSSNMISLNDQNTEQNNTKKFTMGKTRYGRITKLPTYIQEDFKISINDSKSEIRNIIDDKDYKNYNNKEIQTKTILNEQNTQNFDLKIRRERNIPSEYQCKVCNKIFLGKRMQKHYEAHPDHNINAEQQQQHKIVTEMSLYKFLVQKIKLSTENHVDIFLNEISDFVEQLQLRNSRFIQNTSGMHFVNSRISKILGIPEGHYSINVDEIDAPPDPQAIEEIENLNLIIPTTSTSEQNLSISLDDTKLNMITSPDDSLLRTVVNDLMNGDISNLTTDQNHVIDDNALHPPDHSDQHHHHHHHHHHQSSVVINYEHANDNAVEAVSIKETQPPPALLDLSLDLFQFNSN